MIQINYRDPRPIYEQVRDNFRRLILSGVLPAGSKMPSVREIAASLTINPNTIQRSYRELEAEGLICTVPGKGSFVSEMAQAAGKHKTELLDRLTALSDELRMMGVQDDEIIRAVTGGEKND